MSTTRASAPRRAATPRHESWKAIQHCFTTYFESNGPIPRILKLEGESIPVSDVAMATFYFKHQFTLIAQTDYLWPSVAIDFSMTAPQLGKKLVPLDMRDEQISRTPDPAILNGEAQKRAADQAYGAGLSVGYQSPDAAKSTFLEVISAFLKLRTSSPRNRDDDDPPSAEFTVTTDHPQEEVLFATGHFISTSQGFGISTPAIRRLYYGPYIFGLRISGGIKFFDTVWSVPDTTITHLRL